MGSINHREVTMYYRIPYVIRVFFLITVIYLFTSSSMYGFEAHVNGVYFSSDGVAIKAVVKEIENATVEILVRDNTFITPSIAQALITAQKRGATVEVILDTTTKPAPQSPAALLMKAKIPVYLDSAHRWVHNNIMIIDKTIVVTGSFNFHKSGLEKNNSNLLIIKSGTLAAHYTENWYKHREHALQLKGKL